MVAGSRNVCGTHQGVLQRSNLEMDFARSVLYKRSIENRTGRASFFALDYCGNVRWECRFKATFPPNISIEKFCQSAKRIIAVSSAAVERDVFATTASFKRYTVLHNALPVCTTVYVFQANSMHAPCRCRRVVHYKTLVLITQYPRGCWIQEGTRYTPRLTTMVESENGLRKICFVQKIDRESCREGLLFSAV